jgi:hypothetical protein
MTDENPIEASIKYLEECGFTNTEAKNLCGAIRADSPEKLWEDAPAWIEWCAKVHFDYHCIVSLAATGALVVELGPGGIDELNVSLRTKPE